jgi:hypothetical protein
MCNFVPKYDVESAGAMNPLPLSENNSRTFHESMNLLAANLLGFLEKNDDTVLFGVEDLATVYD